MIDSIFIKLRDELEAFFISKEESTPVLIENIERKNSIILTLINIEETSILRNNQYFNRSTLSNVMHESRPVSINLYVLFTADFSGDNGYVRALKKLSFVIEFFREKSFFSFVTSPTSESPAVNELEEPAGASFRASLEMYPLTFEQVNNVWASLGNRQVPFVTYIVKIVSEN